MTLLEWLSALARRIHIIALAVVACALLGLAVIALSPAQYQATARINFQKGNLAIAQFTDSSEKAAMAVHDDEGMRIYVGTLNAGGYSYTRCEGADADACVALANQIVSTVGEQAVANFPSGGVELVPAKSAKVVSPNAHLWRFVGLIALCALAVAIFAASFEQATNASRKRVASARHSKPPQPDEPANRFRMPPRTARR